MFHETSNPHMPAIWLPAISMGSNDYSKPNGYGYNKPILHSRADQHHALTKSLLSIVSCFSFHGKEQGTEPYSKQTGYIVQCHPFQDNVYKLHLCPCLSFVSSHHINLRTQEKYFI